MSSRYIDALEVIAVSSGLIFGFQTMTVGEVTDKEPVKIPATAPAQEVTINTDGNQYATNIVIYCTYLSLGIGLLGAKAIELYKNYRQVDDSTYKGKLSLCESRMEDMAGSLAVMAKHLELIQKSNNQLNNIIEEQVQTLSLLRNPNIQIPTSSINSPAPTPTDKPVGNP